MRALNRNVAFSLLVLLVSVTAGSVAFGYPSDSSWFPRTLSVFLGLMAIVLFLSSRKTANTADADVFGGQVSQAGAAAFVFIAAALYAVAIQFLSF